MKIKIMQSNIWQETTQANYGFDTFVDFIKKEDPDIIFLSEVRNYINVDFLKKLADKLKGHARYFYISTFAMRGPDAGDWDEKGADDTGILSKYPFTHGGKHQKCTYGVIELSDEIKIVAVSAHLDYSYFAQYLPRGHSPDCCDYEKLPSGPVVNEVEILASENKSQRVTQTKEILSLLDDNYKDYLTIIAGDLNTPSFLDWTEETKNHFDRNGAVVSWPVTKLLAENNFIDTYRSVYPDPLKNPGFTWVANTKDQQNPGITDEKIDERDRIDYIFFRPKNNEVNVSKSYISGPPGEYIAGETTSIETDSSKEVYGEGVWFSDHLTLISEIEIKE